MKNDSIVLASGNAHKLSEMRSIFDALGSGIALVSMREAGYGGEPVENGESFSENALIKARTVYEYTGKNTIADDSGLVCEAIGGKPGIYSARFAERECPDASAAYALGETTDERNLNYLLKAMKGKSDRNARFVCVIAFCGRIGGKYTEFCASGECIGRITESASGAGGFGYDPVFFSEKLGMTLGEASAEKKNTVSHRAAAAAAFVGEYKRRLARAAEKDT